MKKIQLHLRNSLALLAAASLFCLVQPARAQSAPAQDNRDDKTVQDNDTTRRELAQFDRFLDSHREISEQLHKDPSLVNNKEFVEKHPALQTFLQQQPGVREELRENPNAFMRQENTFDRREDVQDKRPQLARFDQFLDSHREIAEQLRKNPSLVNNKDFVTKHPALQSFLQDQPGVRDQLRQNPSAFMRQENTFDRREDAGNNRAYDRAGDANRPGDRVNNTNVADRDNNGRPADRDDTRTADRDNNRTADRDNNGRPADRDDTRTADRDNNRTADRDNNGRPAPIETTPGQLIGTTTGPLTATTTAVQPIETTSGQLIGTTTARATLIVRGRTAVRTSTSTIARSRRIVASQPMSAASA